MPQGPTAGLTNLIVRPTVTDGSTAVKEVREIEFVGGSVTAGGDVGEAVVTVGAPRNSARLLAQWPAGTTITNGPIFLLWNTPYDGTVDAAHFFCDTGSFDISVQITIDEGKSGTPVTGLDALVANSSAVTDASATGANEFFAGENVVAIISAASTGPTPTSALLCIDVTWS
jgi:hypothetical protein